jgi:REP element-mobilizing transposase RayT
MYFVTVRTAQARLLLTPSPQVNAVFGGVLARAVERAGVQLHGYVVLSNHLHLLVTARGNSLSSFMQYLLCNVSRKVGRLVDWSGSMWHRRFSAEPVLDDAAADGRLRYILSHGVKEGLVRRPEEWPGLSCLAQLRDGGTQTHMFFRWAQRWESGALVDGGEDRWSPRWAEEVRLTLTPLPHWRELSDVQRQARVDELVRGIIEEHAPRHPHPLGVDGVLRQQPHARRPHPEMSREPLLHATDSQVRQAFLALRREWYERFRAASRRLRDQTEDAYDFPALSTAPAFHPPARKLEKMPGTFGDVTVSMH